MYSSGGSIREDDDEDEEDEEDEEEMCGECTFSTSLIETSDRERIVRFSDEESNFCQHEFHEEHNEKKHLNTDVVFCERNNKTLV